MILPFLNSDTYCYAFFLIIQSITLYSEQTFTLQPTFQMRNPLYNFPFMHCFRYPLSLLHHLNVKKYQSFAYLNLFFFSCNFDLCQITPSWCCNFIGQQCIYIKKTFFLLEWNKIFYYNYNTFYIACTK